MNARRSFILTYHSLDTSGSVISTAPEVFREQMACLAGTGVPVVPLTRVRETPGAVALTFDDGFRNFIDVAVPVLARYKFPATVFVVSDFCGKRNDWPSQPRDGGVPTLELMAWEEVRKAAKAGIDIGCHTATHPFLTRLPDAQLDEEMRNCRKAVEDRTGAAADTFAYPYGDFNPRVRQAAERHFRLACTTTMGFLKPHSGWWDSPRLDVYYLRNPLWFRGLGEWYGSGYIYVRSLLRSVRNAFA